MQTTDGVDILAEQAVDQTHALCAKLLRVCQRSNADLEVAAVALTRLLGQVLASLDADAEMLDMAVEMVRLAAADSAEHLRRGKLQCPQRASGSVRFRAPKARPGVTFPMALEALRAGEVLQLTFIKAAPIWRISDYPVSPEVVSLLLSHVAIEPCGDGLPFDGAASQTWRIRQ